MCRQAPWSRAPSCSSVGPACPRSAPTAALSACGTSSGTTLARTSPKSPCLCSSTRRSTRCRGCAKSWSTASYSTGPPTHWTPLSAWWGRARGSFFFIFSCRQRGKLKLKTVVSVWEIIGLKGLTWGNSWINHMSYLRPLFRLYI